MATPRDHIERIRKTKFSLNNPLSEDLHQAVKHLSAELYSKDVHFLMELIQNAEDNTYAPDVQPSLEFVITSEDVCEVGATATLLVCNNETGFQKHNIDSMCSVGRSTKKKREGGYIGEKGIGFKSVFLITSQPCIFSNGYKIRFHDVPPPGANIGYIVPEWIERRPSITQLKEIYGCQLPNTVIVLPLRPEKVEAVKKELTNIHPEVILFMSKIKKLSVREIAVDPSLNKINTISVSRETDFQSSESEDSEAFRLHLSAEENKRSTGRSSYYMWRQRFPVENEFKVEQRKEVGKWAITLAFPFDKRLTRGNMAAPGIYAFLPTEMVTGFPFVIQADFLLVSSRESIIFDNKWNQGILERIPFAFCSAFRFFSYHDSLPSSKSHFYKYIPVDLPRYKQLLQIRNVIQAQLRKEEIIFCDSSFVNKDFGRPTETRTMLPVFRSILERAREQGRESCLDDFLAGEHKIVHSCLDQPEFSTVLGFLQVGKVSYNWYAGCIRSYGWVKCLSEDLYVELLCFIAEHWKAGLSSPLQNTNTPFLKYVYSGNNTVLASVPTDEVGTRIYFSSQQSHIWWLTKWSEELQSAAKRYFMPESTQKAIRDLDGNKGDKLRQWLKEYPKIIQLSISSFAEQLRKVVKSSTNRKLVINVAHFFYCSYVNKYLGVEDLLSRCSDIPIVDELGIVKQRDYLKILVPALISKWAKLMGSNPWTGQNFVALSEDYLTLPSCAGGLTNAGKNLVSFVKEQLGALDIPELTPPDVSFTFRHLPKENAFFLLEWINGQELPRCFKQSILEGKWLKTGRGFESPAKSFWFDFSWRYASELEEDDVPCIDEAFYGNDIDGFKDALEKVGVVTRVGGGCDAIVDYHIQMHTDLKAITRLYKYLQASKWEPYGNKVLPIWIPDERKWMSAKSCVIHDVDGHFKSRMKVLENWYDEQLVEFFANSLGVPSYPRIEDYCFLWRDRAGNDNHGTAESECCLVWRHIVQNWSTSSSLIKQSLGSGCKVPVYTNNGDIRVSSPGQAYVPDDLQLKELFRGGSSMVNFTWHPNPSDPQIPLDTLFSIYNHMGVRNISQAVRKTEVSMQHMSLPNLKLGMGLYRICVAYLAKPSFKFSADKRHQLVRALIDCPVYEVTGQLKVEYSLLVAPNEVTGQLKVEYSLLVAPNVKVNKKAMVRWEKHPKQLLIQTPDRNNEKEKMLYVTNFAEAIAQGLLVAFPDLVEGLCEIIKLGCAFSFNLEAVDFMLQSKNLQLFIEDERFLSSYFD